MEKHFSLRNSVHKGIIIERAFWVNSSHKNLCRMFCLHLSSLWEFGFREYFLGE